MKYVRFTFENTEPLKLADDSRSESGQINCLSYVPGSALRGAVVSAFVKAGEFDAFKTTLLSDSVAFLNAYIISDGKELIPSVKGFYEDKTDAVNGEKAIENMMLDGEITPGNKRASLGKYCFLDGERICYTDVRMGSDMKINKGKSGKQNVFRNSCITPGNLFAGYIAFTDEAAGKKILAVMENLKENNELELGGNRSYGYGKCVILDAEITDKLPYGEYAQGDGSEPASDQIYMVLVSDMAMVSETGEMTGIDTGILGEKLGLPSGPEIRFCSTSVVDVRGYNRTMQSFIPSAKMYEKGSAFKLVFPGETVSADNLDRVMHEGLGIRKNEGFGRVLFMDLDAISIKQSIPETQEEPAGRSGELSEDENDTLMIAAKGYYTNLIDRAITRYLADSSNGLERFHLNSSRLGTIESILLNNLYKSGKEGFKKLDEYFSVTDKKENDRNTQKDVPSLKKMKEYIQGLRDKQLPELLGIPDQVMGIPYDKILSKDRGEVDRVKQELIIAQIKFANRGGVENE